MRLYRQLFIALAAAAAKADGIQVIHLEADDALGTLLDRTQECDSLVISGWMDATSVPLPSWLSGTFEIQLVPEDSSYYFYGIINL